MASNIKIYGFLQTGNGIPNHISNIGTFYLDLNSSILYQNKNGAALWTYFLDSTTVITASGSTSGTYTPTLTLVNNITSATTYEAQYIRVNTSVTVSGKLDLDPILVATTTQLGISLPIASDFGANEDCGGVAFASGIANQGAAIRADITNNRAEMVYISSDVTNQSMYYTFTYQII